MHILIGAIAGAVWAVTLRAGYLAATGKGFELKDLALAAMGGAVGGAIAAATLGAGGVAAASTARQVFAFTGGGASGATSEQVAENVAHDRPLTEGVAKAATVGAATGLVSLGLERGIGRAIGSRFHGADEPKLPARFFTAPAPSAGHGPRVALQDEDAAPNRWGRSLQEAYQEHQSEFTESRAQRRARRRRAIQKKNQELKDAIRARRLAEAPQPGLADHLGF